MDVRVSDLRDVARPGHRGREIALREQRRVVVARELADLLRVDRLLDPVERRVERLVRDLRRVVSIREHHHRERVAHRVEAGDLALQLRIREQVVDRQHRVCELVIVGDAAHAGLPRQAVVAVRVEVRVLLNRDEVLHVRDRRLIEVLDPAFLDHQREVAVVVGEDDDVTVDRLSAGQRALDLPEERGVVVDVLDVVHVHAVLLLEVDERRVRVRLVVRVDVQRPVREVECLGKLVVGAAARRLRAAAAAGGENAGNAEEGAACGRAPQQVAPGDDVGHSGASIESTRNVDSGLQLSMSRSPGAAPFSPGDAFCR